MSRPPSSLALVCLGAWMGVLAGVGSPTTVIAQTSSFEQPPIDYLNTEVHDGVALLAAKIQSGETKLHHDSKWGYLKSVLEALDIPISSQTLVFSKTSLQLHRISPRRPRALYFNDDIYVGYCQHGEVLELAATDAQQGATFYTLDQNAERPVKFVRDRGGCLSCHASTRTQNVPGYLVRSVFADAAGRPKLGSGSFTTDHTSPFQDRWGGWYVTGEHGSMRHMGNTICMDDETTFDRDAGANKNDLSDQFQIDAYPSAHSDIVALMVLEHQTQMHNAMAAANYETRQALHQSYQMNELLERPADHISESAQRRIAASADRVLRHLLMSDEFELTDCVHGSSTFATEFTARGKCDDRGRSLRQFNLQTRLFENPCSYLIGSDAFAALPTEVRSAVLTGLLDVLENRNDSEDFSHLTPAMRADILAILLATMPELTRHRTAIRTETRIE